MNTASDTSSAVPSPSHPLQFVLVTLAGWFNQRQRDVIDYLLEENRVLREQLGTQAPALHRRPATSARREGSDAGATAVAAVRHDRHAGHVANVAQSLIAERHDGSSRRGPGRPPIMSEIQTLTVRMAAENSRLRLYADPKRLGEPESRSFPRHDRPPSSANTAWSLRRIG